MRSVDVIRDVDETLLNEGIANIGLQRHHHSFDERSRGSAFGFLQYSNTIQYWNVDVSVRRKFRPKLDRSDLLEVNSPEGARVVGAGAVLAAAARAGARRICGHGCLLNRGI